jgi:hypothetical protein
MDEPLRNGVGCDQYGSPGPPDSAPPEEKPARVSRRTFAFRAAGCRFRRKSLAGSGADDDIQQ